MGSYIPTTPSQREVMLAATGIQSAEQLYDSVPERIRLAPGALKLPQGLSELELVNQMNAIAGRNTVFPAVFRGAGAYKHFIPAVVSRVSAKEAFVTAYTPYQPEISQGVLQSIFEYQTMIAELTGMDVSNASVYDGAVAAAEAMAMCREKGRTVTLISAACHPDTIATVKTYCFGAGTDCVVVPAAGGHTDAAALKGLLSDKTAGFLFQSPNYFGVIEDAAGLIELAHAAGAKCVMSVNPVSLGLLQSPGELGADVAVGDGQPLGMPLSFGGPYLGFMTCKSELVRRLPGRIVGKTQDAAGNRCFVLTLQAREQHIRREKASSNICSNQALCALTAAAYMAAMGFSGIRQAATLSYHKAHYLAEQLCAIPGFALRHPGAPFFHEFLTETSVPAETLLSALAQKGMLGGLPVDGGLLWCATEMNGRAEIDALIKAVKEAAK